MEQQSLFSQPLLTQPLASRMRPRTLEEFCGQKHLLGPDKVLQRMIDADSVPSMIFWGPPEKPHWRVSLPGAPRQNLLIFLR